MKRPLTLLISLLISVAGLAQIPANYYSRADGKAGYALKTALCAIITAGHTAVGYDNLWEVYKTTDVRPDGYLWDMYSDFTNYPIAKPSGNYSSEGDIPNREHSFPKSWWGGGKSVPYSDAMHVIPADAYVNNRRGNYPFGETSNPTYSSHGGFSKVGPCDAAIGYTGTVFEPNDEYKGDFARIYFYMATRYQNDIASWDSPMLAGNSDSVYTKWALTMLMRWAEQDPVSQKETDRNNAVHAAQGNRNPFVDFPGLEQYVWGSKRTTPFCLSDYTNPGGQPTDPIAPSAPVFSVEGGTVMQYTTLTITSPDALPVFYSTDGSEYVQVASPFNVTLEADITISAYCERGGIQSDTISHSFTVIPVEVPVGGIFELVTATTDLLPGAYYLIVNESAKTALGPASKDVRSNVGVSISEHTIDLNSQTTAGPTVLQLVESDGHYAFFVPSEQAYLALTSDANSLKTATDLVQGALWDVRFIGDNVEITNRQYTNRYICYNSGSPRFAAYKSTSRQQVVQLYRERQSQTGLNAPGMDLQRDATPAYTIDGRRLSAGRPLSPGVYIIGGRKVVIK